VTREMVDVIFVPIKLDFASHNLSVHLLYVQYEYPSLCHAKI
jgi:hypothetical protein